MARLICSDEECTEVFEARAVTLAELEALACDCGCALQVISISEAAAGHSRDHGLELLPVG